MNVETRETGEGTLIEVETDRKVALAVKKEGGERIYLPHRLENDSSYYVESSEGLSRSGNVYRVVHEGEIKGIEVIEGE